MDKETMTFTTARGASIPLEFYAKFHTKYPMLSGIDLSEIIKRDWLLELDLVVLL